ncbi:MAG: hypothetical protein ABR905_17590 [Terracidiphilus sp.]|jgi:hypothetical protein
MDNTDWKILERLVSQWQEFELRMSQLHNSIELKPSVPNKPVAFVRSDASTATFDCGLTLVNLPERAGRTQSLPLYLVFRGDIIVDKSHFAKTEVLRTVHFRTEAAYFRYKSDPDRLKHVYGAHFDFDTDLTGHPRFHAQHRSFGQFSAEVDRHLGKTLPLDDCMSEVLNTVRLPCAQMDFFSVLLQAVADRLIATTASQQEREIFEQLIQISKRLHGCGHLVPSLHSTEASSCYRSPHWY